MLAPRVGRACGRDTPRVCKPHRRGPSRVCHARHRLTFPPHFGGTFVLLAVMFGLMLVLLSSRPSSRLVSCRSFRLRAVHRDGRPADGYLGPVEVYRLPPPHARRADVALHHIRADLRLPAGNFEGAV